MSTSSETLSLKSISPSCSTSGQLSTADIDQAEKAGFRSILNLRFPSESSVVEVEPQQVQSKGLIYANTPLSSQEVDPPSLAHALETLAILPEPVLIHCGAGQRAGAVGLIAEARIQGWTAEQVAAAATELGIPTTQPHLRWYIDQLQAGQPDPLGGFDL
ncbi:MAG: hypothetical protein OHK0012_19570 [Synechococcales cyanobacterium]